MRDGKEVKPTFRSSDDSTGVTVNDPIQGRRVQLRTPDSATPRSVDAEGFYFPVGGASEITTDSIALPYVVAACVRDESGTLVREATHNASERLPEDDYIVELMAPIKVYLRFESALSIRSSSDRMRFSFGDETRVRIGARSNHRQPAATVTTTGAPRDLMAAVSTFGSALKTTSCERSLPSLRGHPPRIAIGDELHIPETLSAPDTGVRIELPPDRGMVYVTSTLAYYLGATVVPGDEPRLVTDEGFVHPLDHAERGFEGEVERVLKQVFFLDCITRTEGYYQVELCERRRLEERAALPWNDLYDASLSEQLPAYLDVPFETIEDLLPTWRLASHATSDAATAELLPFAANGLSTVRLTSFDTEADPDRPLHRPIDIDEFVRTAEGNRTGPGDEESRKYVAPSKGDALERAWLGEGRPLEANKLVKAAFENKFDRERSADDIDITIVCNDAAMSAEYDDGALYGNRDALPFDVTVHRNLTVEAFRDILRTETDFLHYIGHVESGAFVCADGRLDAGELDRVAVDTFLLNGCKSYEQGLQLVDAGSVGGIATYSDVGNDGATDLGRLVARLLNSGFSLRAALEVARGQQITGNQYVVVGDGGAQIAQNEAGTPVVCDVASLDEPGQYELRLTTHPTIEQGMGALYTPHLDDVKRYYLSGGTLPPFTVSIAELLRFLSLEQLPVIIEGELRWSNDEETYDFLR